jgi:hypothetical protein
LRSVRQNENKSNLNVPSTIKVANISLGGQSQARPKSERTKSNGPATLRSNLKDPVVGITSGNNFKPAFKPKINSTTKNTMVVAKSA